MFREDNSSLWHLGVSLFLGKATTSPEQCWFAMLTAYFDDSGSETTPALVFCGYVAPLDQWLRFEHDWRAVLALPQFQLEYFHMKELRQGRGQFAKFKDNMPLQRDLFERLHRVIDVRTMEGFASAIVMPDYEAVNRQFRMREELNEPHVAAGRSAIGKMMAWRRTAHPSESMKVVVDQGVSGFGKLSDAVYKDYKFRIIPEIVKDSPPLQAGDLIGWELQREMARTIALRMGKAVPPTRRSFTAILRRFRVNHWGVLDEPHLQKLCAAFEVSARGSDAPEPDASLL